MRLDLLIIWLLFQVGYLGVSFLLATILTFALDAPPQLWWVIFCICWVLFVLMDYFLKPRES